jgi:hypothetical protein
MPIPGRGLMYAKGGYKWAVRFAVPVRQPSLQWRRRSECSRSRFHRPQEASLRLQGPVDSATSRLCVVFSVCSPEKAGTPTPTTLGASDHLPPQEVSRAAGSPFKAEGTNRLSRLEPFVPSSVPALRTGLVRQPPLQWGPRISCSIRRGHEPPEAASRQQAPMDRAYDDLVCQALFESSAGGRYANPHYIEGLGSPAPPGKNMSRRRPLPGTRSQWIEPTTILCARLSSSPPLEVGTPTPTTLEPPERLPLQEGSRAAGGRSLAEWSNESRLRPPAAASRLQALWRRQVRQPSLQLGTHSRSESFLQNRLLYAIPPYNLRSIHRQAPSFNPWHEVSCQFPVAMGVIQGQI